MSIVVAHTPDPAGHAAREWGVTGAAPAMRNTSTGLLLDSLVPASAAHPRPA